RWHASSNGLHIWADSKANEYFAWIRLWAGMVRWGIHSGCKIPKRGSVRVGYLAPPGHTDGHLFSTTTAFEISRTEIRYFCWLHLPLTLDRAGTLGCDHAIEIHSDIFKHSACGLLNFSAFRVRFGSIIFGSRRPHRRGLLWPHKRTSSVRPVRSEKCHFRPARAQSGCPLAPP